MNLVLNHVHSCLSRESNGKTPEEDKEIWKSYLCFLWNVEQDPNCMPTYMTSADLDVSCPLLLRSKPARCFHVCGFKGRPKFWCFICLLTQCTLAENLAIDSWALNISLTGYYKIHRICIVKHQKCMLKFAYSQFQSDNYNISTLSMKAGTVIYRARSATSVKHCLSQCF